MKSLVISFIALCHLAYGASFGPDGFTTFSFPSPSQSGRVHSIFLDKIGRIVLAGDVAKGVIGSLFVGARILEDGALDTSYGKDGKSTLSTEFVLFPSRSVLQSTGKLIAAGTTFIGEDLDFVLTRRTENGAPDTSFGKNGVITTDVSFGSQEFVTDVLVGKDDRILIAGTSFDVENSDFVMVRYYSNGEMDDRFGNGGRVITDLGNRSIDNLLAAIGTENDGILVIGGTGKDEPSQDLVLVRYLKDGSFDPQFGAGGKRVFSLNGRPTFVSKVLNQKDSKILFSALVQKGTVTTHALYRFEKDGTWDTSFGSEGKVPNPFQAPFFQFVLLPDGKILLAGYKEGKPAFARLESNGKIDETFGEKGILMATTSLPAGLSIQSFELQSDGKWLLSGTVSTPNEIKFVVLRFLPDGTLDRDS